jgi:hypothetical protein
MANRCLHTKYKHSRWNSDETCHPQNCFCILTSVTLKSRSNQKPKTYVIVCWDKPTIKIWSSYLWPLTSKWQVWFSRWPPRGENIGQIAKMKKNWGIARRYHHTKYQLYSHSGYETCSANGRTPRHGNSSPDPGELKSNNPPRWPFLCSPWSFPWHDLDTLLRDDLLLLMLPALISTYSDASREADVLPTGAMSMYTSAAWRLSRLEQDVEAKKRRVKIISNHFRNNFFGNHRQCGHSPNTRRQICTPVDLTSCTPVDLTSLRPSHRRVSPLILTLTVFKIWAVQW